MLKVSAVLLTLAMLASATPAAEAQVRVRDLQRFPMWSCTIQGRIGDLFKEFDGYGATMQAAQANGVRSCKASRFPEGCYVKSCRPGL